MGTYCFFSKTREQSNPTKSFNRQVQLFTLIGDSVKFLTMTPNDPCCVFTHTLKDPALAFILMLIQSTVWLEGRIKWQGKMEVLSCQRQISVHRAGNVCVCVYLCEWKLSWEDLFIPSNASTFTSFIAHLPVCFYILCLHLLFIPAYLPDSSSALLFQCSTDVIIICWVAGVK